jgi:mRNA interferase MazF
MQTRRRASMSMNANSGSPISARTSESEQDGRGDQSLRPILVLRKFNNEIAWVLPLTRRNKPANPYYVAFDYIVFPEVEGAPLASSVAILSQLRLLDIKRFRYKIGTAPAVAFETIKEKTKRLLA